MPASGLTHIPRNSAGAGDEPRPYWRRAAVLLVALLSTAFAAAVLWTWINPAVLASARAATLVALLALFVLPAGVTWLDRVERRRRSA